MIQGFSSGLIGNRELIYETDLPSFQRDFASLKTLDHGYGPSITFTRASNATFFDVNGVLQTAGNNVPRFDHDPVTGASRGLLIEEARTNLLVRSAEFDNASWVKAGASITQNATAAPDGTSSADKFVESNANEVHQVWQTPSGVIGVQTASVFVKAAERTFCQLLAFNETDQTIGRVIVNLSNGSLSSITGTATSTSIGNGWYRVSLTYTTTVNNTSFNIYPRTSVDQVITAYTGDGTSGIFIWGAQLEAGAFPTSYIPTTSATATRSADSAVVTPISSFYNQSEGTMFCESASTALVAGDTQGIWGFGDDTLAFASGNFLYTSYANGIQHRIAFNIAVLGAGQIGSLDNTGVAQSANTFARSAVVYKQDDYAISTNGSSVATDTSAAVPPMPTGLSIGSLDRAWASGGNHINGWIKKFAYYPKRLSNTLLQQLTT